jgi:uncharacterized protein (DUF1800 family)
MDRRNALATIVDSVQPADDPPPHPSPISEFANVSVPQVLRTAAGLEPYAGTWGSEERLHLLRRTMFGPSREDLEASAGLSLDQLLATLLSTPTDEPSRPLNTNDRDVVPVGESWVDAVSRDTVNNYTPTGTRKTSLRSWWLQLMITQQLSVREKMVLFWHNHFVTEIDTVNDPRYSYRYLDILRRNALGNFKDLVRQITLDGAMLIYLNGNRNTKRSPNENYGRELQELFTVGKGPEVAQGDYTNYTEADVKAAAKVLTGWKNQSNPDDTVGPVTWTFDPAQHDTGDKQFSNRYQERLILGRSGDDGALELDDLLEIIFDQQETARFICRKLYRWFVYYLIDEATEANVITPMADLLRSNNYEVRPVLELLLRSAHFFDPVNRGCSIKSPIDFTVGMARQFALTFPAGDVVITYTLLNYLVGQASGMQQYLGDPPDVAGWSPYYQAPQFYEIWVNSDTLPRRKSLSDRLAGSGYRTGGQTLAIDPIAFARSLPGSADPNLLIEEACRFLYPVPVTTLQKEYFKDALIPGLPDYEWTIEWADYLSDPGDMTKESAVAAKLRGLFSTMLAMPEYQLQ